MSEGVVTNFYLLCKMVKQLGAGEICFTVDTSKMFSHADDQGQSGNPHDTWLVNARCERRYNQYLPDAVSHVSSYSANGRTGDEALRTLLKLMEGDPPHAIREQRSKA